MHFNLNKKGFTMKTVFFLSMLMFVTACSDKDLNFSGQDEHLIGMALASISPMTSPGAEDTTQVAIYDETIRKVHHFDLNNAGLIKTFDVLNNGAKVKHYELLGLNGKYIVDLSYQNISLYDSAGGAISHNPLSFRGTPKSGAFQPHLGNLIIYDDLSSVGILKLDANGRVLKSWVSGPSDGASSVSAGDLSSNGDLILAYGSGDIKSQDVDQSVAQRTWVNKFTWYSNIRNILWLAPIPGNHEQILVRNQSKIYLLNMYTQTILAEFSLTDYEVVKYSKLENPHLLLRKITSGAERNDLIVVYIDSSELKTKTLHGMKKAILSSRLNLAKDSFTILDTEYYNTYYGTKSITLFDYSDYTKESRSLTRYRFSDMLSERNISLGNQQTSLSQNFLFSLFPSKLGYATRYDLVNGQQVEMKRFNMGHIK